VRSVFSEEKKLSIAALSQTLPDRLIEQTTPWSASNRWNCSLVYWANSSGGRNALMKEVAMKLAKRRSDRSGRATLFSPGRPSLAGRDERRRFWAAIAVGLESVDAALAAGVPPAIGTRWFRTAGYYRRCLDDRPNRFRDVISRLQNGRKSASFARKAIQSRRLLVGLGGRQSTPARSGFESLRSHQSLYPVQAAAEALSQTFVSP
jgi:hypothetical protein